MPSSSNSSARSAFHATQASPQNTVRLARADLERLQDELDLATPGGATHRRSHVRWPFRSDGVRIDIFGGGRVASSLRYACRNLSSGGLSFLHSTFMHTGTRCTAHLPRLSGESVELPGAIVRCRHFRRHVHELAMAFDHPIEVSRFVNLDPFKSRFSMERVDGQALAGSLLHVEPGATERRLLRHFLRDTNVGVVSVENGAEALARGKETFEFIVVDALLPDMTGTDLVLKLRAAEQHAPIILTAPEPDDALREAARVARASAILAKPLDEGMVLRALADLAGGGAGGDAGGGVCSTLASDDPARALVAEYIPELHKMAKDLAVALDAGDVAAVRHACLRVRSTATPLGFGLIAESAGAALKLLAANNSVNESATPLKALLSACLRARADEPARKAA